MTNSINRSPFKSDNKIGKKKQRRNSSVSSENLNRSRQSADSNEPKEADNSSSILKKYADELSGFDNDTDRFNALLEIRKAEDQELSRQRNSGNEEDNSAVDDLALSLDGRRPDSDQVKLWKAQKRQQNIDEWLQQFDKGRKPIEKSELPAEIPTDADVDRTTDIAITEFKREGVRTLNEYKFNNVNKFLKKFQGDQRPKVYIMEGAYPKKDSNPAAKYAAKQAAKLPIAINRKFNRSGADSEEHGVSVASLAHYTYPETDMTLYVALSDPAQDFTGEYDAAGGVNMTAEKAAVLNAKSKNLSFQNFFKELNGLNNGNGVQNSVINLSQMVTPNERVTEDTIKQIRNLVYKNNIIVLATGNYSAKIDKVPAFELIHKEIESLKTDPQAKGAIVLVENLKSEPNYDPAFDQPVKATIWNKNPDDNKTEVSETSNYIESIDKKSTALALRGQRSPEVPGIRKKDLKNDHGWAPGNGTSYAAPKLSALISQLTTAASIAKGKTVNGKDVVAALVNSSRKVKLTKVNAYDDQVNKLEEDDLEDLKKKLRKLKKEAENDKSKEDELKEYEVIVQIPDGDTAFKELLKSA